MGLEEGEGEGAVRLGRGGVRGMRELGRWVVEKCSVRFWTMVVRLALKRSVADGEEGVASGVEERCV